MKQHLDILLAPCSLTDDHMEAAVRYIMKKLKGYPHKFFIVYNTKDEWEILSTRKISKKKISLITKGGKSMAKKEKKKKKVNRNELKQKKVWSTKNETIGKEARNVAARFANSFVEITVKMLEPDEMSLPLFFRDEKIKIQCNDHEFILEETQLRLDDPKFAKKGKQKTLDEEFNPEEHIIKEE